LFRQVLIFLVIVMQGFCLYQTFVNTAYKKKLVDMSLNITKKHVN